MNVQSKKILFNKSSLLSLKAELYKKREEVIDKKQLPENRIENYKRPKAKASENTEEKGTKKSFKDGLKAVDAEEMEAYRKSKSALEKKAELYEHLSAGDSQLASRFLVDFKAKKDEEAKELAKVVPEEEEPVVNDDDNVGEEANDEWIEFTDCLGRTRKCHKSDLEMFKQRDKDLMRIMFNEPGQDGDETGKTSEEPQKEKPLLVQTTNDYLQSLRQKWEEKERELLAKDKDIHYQDLLFDEARIHGVGYYSFSTDETERQKQMQQLLKEREATLQAQKQAEEQRRKREEIMAARVKAARARQRMRAGLPPEEPEDTTKQFTDHLLEFLTQQRNEADAKAKEEERKRKEELEKERQKLREAYVREWDLGKDGVEQKAKKFRVLTQEEYVEQQRDKRIEEFAPLKTSSSDKSNYVFDDRGKMLQSGESKTWSDVRPKAATPPPPDVGDINEQKGLYFTTKKQNEPGPSNTEMFVPQSTSFTHKDVKYSNFVKAQEPTLVDNEVSGTHKQVKYKNFVKAQEPNPIVNELSDDDDGFDGGRKEREPKSNNSGVEVAPPPTYDYYGPVPKKQKFQKPFDSDIREAYAQGAKSLEAKSKCRQISKDYDFMFD